MSDLAAVLTRLAVDSQYRVLLAQDPDTALRGYSLEPEDAAALRTPGPGWVDLWARAVGASDVARGPAWDLRAPPVAAPAPSALRWPGAAVWLRVRRVRRDDKTPAWQVDLRGDEPEPEADATDLRLDLADLGGWVSATLRPAQATAEAGIPASEADSGRRWRHGEPWGHGRAALAAARGERHDRLLELARAVREGIVEPGDPPPVFAHSPQVVVVGLGITGVDQVTREAELAVRRARRVYHVDAGLAADAWLRALNPHVVPLFSDVYRTHESRLAAYDRVAVHVLEGALDAGSVVLAVQGHPLMFSYAPALLVDAGRALGVRVVVQPGVSADACIFAELGLDPGDHGLQAYECTDLLLRRRPLAPDVPLVLWQVGNLETRLHQGRPSRPGRLLRLQAWLLAFYPSEHPVIAVYVSPHPGVPRWQRTVSLQDLPSMAAELHAGVTLYLPPVRRRPLADPELAALVDDPAHLGDLTD